MKKLVKNLLITIWILLLVPLWFSFTKAWTWLITSSSGWMDFKLEYDIQPDIVLSGDVVNFIMTWCLSGANEDFTWLIYYANVNWLDISSATWTTSNGTQVNWAAWWYDKWFVTYYSTNISAWTTRSCITIKWTWTVDSWSFSYITPENFWVSFWTWDYSTAKLYEIVLMSWWNHWPDYQNDNFYLYPKVEVSITKSLTWLAPQKSWDYVDYQFSVFASWATWASNLHLQDLLPTKLTCISLLINDSNYPASNFDTTTCSFDIANVWQNDTWTYIVRTQVNDTVVKDEVLTNTWILTTWAVQTWLTILNSPQVYDTIVLWIPDLFISNSSVSNPYDTDDTITYTTTIWNSWTQNTTWYFTLYINTSLVTWFNQNIWWISPVIYSDRIVWSGFYLQTWSANDISISLTWKLLNDELSWTILTFTWTIYRVDWRNDRESTTWNNEEVTNWVVIGRPDLYLTKTFTSDSTSAHSGDNVTYILNFDNINWTATATWIQVNDLYDSNYFEPQSRTWNLSCGDITLNWNITDHPVVFDLDDMIVWCTWKIILTWVLINDVPPNYDLINTWYITTTTQELHTSLDSPNTWDASFQLDAYVDITTSKDLLSVLYPNWNTWTEIYWSWDIVTFLITVTNNWNSTYTFDVSDNLSPTSRFTDIQIDPNLNSVDAYSTVTWWIKAKVVWDDILDQFTNTVNLSWTNFDVNSSAVYTWKIFGRAYLSIQKEVIWPDLDWNWNPNQITDWPYYTWDEVIFKLTLTNTWTTWATVDLWDVAPSNITINPSTNQTVVVNAWDSTGIIITWTLTNSVPWTYMNTWYIDPTSVSNPNQIFITQQTWTVDFEVYPKREISINKQFVSITYWDDDWWTCDATSNNCPVYWSGDELTFDITITNTWNAEITWLTITDLIPSDSVFVSNWSSAWWTSNWNWNDVELTWITLWTWWSSDSIKTFTIVLRLTDDNIDTNWTNEVQIDTWNVSDWTNNVDELVPWSDTATLNKLWRAHLSIEKTVLNNDIEDWPYYPGDEITFHFVITNTWTRDATWIDLQDEVEQIAWNNVLNIPTLPTNITIPANGNTWFDVVFTVAWTKWQYLWQFTNTWSIVDTNWDFVRQWTIIEKTSDPTFFHIRPKTELSIEKTYCWMFGDCANPQDPYWQRYNWERQTAWFRIIIHNSWNIQATWIDLHDILPNVLSWIEITNPWYFVSSTRWEWTWQTIDMDDDLILYITWQLNTEQPQQFTNTAYFDETNHCSNSDYITTSQWSWCQIILNPSDDATWNILWMAHVSIQKDTLKPWQCRVDVRWSDWNWNDYPWTTTWINWQTCIDWPALPWDTIWFKIRLINTWTRLATGLSLYDYFPNWYSYPTNNNSDNDLELSWNLYYVSSDWTTWIVSAWWTSNDPTFNISNVIIPTWWYVDFYLTWKLTLQTWYDVWIDKLNTWEVYDPDVQSWVVIEWSDSTTRRQSDSSFWHISEYMQWQIIKYTKEPWATDWALSWDEVWFGVDFANIWNTWFYFQVVDTLPDEIDYNSANATINLDNTWDFIYNNISCWWDSCEPDSPINWSPSSDKKIVNFWSPVKYLTINWYWHIDLTWLVVDVFGIANNVARLDLDDNEFNHSQYSYSDTSTINSRAQLLFEKTIVTDWPTQAGDDITFKLTIINTWWNDIVFSWIVKDRIPWCLTLKSSSNSNEFNRNDWHNVRRDFSSNPITIFARSGYSLILTATVNSDINWQYCFTNPFNGYNNKACFTTWSDVNSIDFDENDIRCDSATWKLLQWLFDIQKTMITPNPRFTGDYVVFQLNITNNSNSPWTVIVNDFWPTQSNFVDYISNDWWLVDVWWWVYSWTFNIDWNTWIVITLTWKINDNAIPTYLWQIFTNTWEIYFNWQTWTSIATWMLLTWIYVQKLPQSQIWLSWSLVNFDLIITNYTTWNLDYIKITDLFPNLLDWIKYINANPQASNHQDLLSWQDIYPERRADKIPSLSPWQSYTINLTWKVYSDSNWFDYMVNTWKFEVCQDPNVWSTCQTVWYWTSLIESIPDLQIIKYFTANEPQQIGDPIEYDLVVKNIWSKVATWVAINDNWPQNYLPQNPAPTFTVYYNWVKLSSNTQPVIQGQSYVRSSANWHTWLDSVNPWDEIRIHISTVLSNQNMNVWDCFLNTWYVLSESQEYTWLNAWSNTWNIRVCLRWTPDLRIKKQYVWTTWDRPQISWDVINYRIDYWNSWTESITWRNIVDTYPGFLTYSWILAFWWVEVSWCSLTGTNQIICYGSWELTINNTNTWYIVLQFVLNDNYLSYELNSNNCFTNTWNINMPANLDYLEKNKNNNLTGSESVCVLWRPDLVIEKKILEGSTGSAKWRIVKYEIDYTNSWTAIATWRYIEDLLPSELTWYEFDPQPSYSWIIGNRLQVRRSWEDLVWWINWLKPGENWTIIITGIVEHMLIADWTNDFCNTWIIYTWNWQIDFNSWNNIDDACVIPWWWFYTHKNPTEQYWVSWWLVKFEFWFENNTNNNICVAMSDRLSDYGFFCYDWPNCQYWDKWVVYTWENVSQFDSWTAVFTAVVAPNRYDFSKLTNIAEFTIVPYVWGKCDWWTILETQTSSADVLPIADIVVNKSFVSEWNPRHDWDEVNFVLKFKNIWWVQATGVNVCDWFPNELKNISTNPNMWVIPYNNCKNWLQNQTINPWQTLTINIESQLSWEYNPWYVFCNTGEVFARSNWFTWEYDPNQFDNYQNVHVDTSCVMVEWTPDLRIKKQYVWTTGDRPQVSWDVVNYRIDFWNSGNWNVSWLSISGDEIVFTWRTIEDTYPEYLTYSWIIESWGTNVELVWPILDNQKRKIIFLWSWELLANDANDWYIILQFVLNDNYLSYKINFNNCFINTWNINMPIWFESREDNIDNNLSWSESVCVLWKPDLRIRKEILTGQYPDMKWDAVVYQLIYWNSWTAILTWRELYDELPDYLTWFEFSSWWIVSVLNPYEITRTWKHLWLENWMPINYTWTIIITWYLADNYPTWSWFCNTWFVYDNAWNELQDWNTWNNTSEWVCSIIWWAPDLWLIKTYSWWVVKSWDIMSFQLEYYNTWTLTATWPITVIDYLPSIFDYITWSSTVVHSWVQTDKFTVETTKTSTWTIVTWIIDTWLVYNTSWIIDFDVILNKTLTWWEDITNTWYIVAVDPEPNYDNNTSVITFQSIILPELEINKELLQDWSWRYGDEISFALNFQNYWILWSWDATWVIITDVIPTWMNFDCSNVSLQQKTWEYIPWIWRNYYYIDYPDTTWQCSTRTINWQDYLQITNLNISGQVEWRVVMTWNLNFQPLSRFCWTNTWTIDRWYLSGTQRISTDYYTWNNLSIVSWCMEPNFGVEIIKTAYPERETMTQTELANSGLDISWAIVWFDIQVINSWDITITWKSLYDILQTSWLPTNYWTWITNNATDNLLSSDLVLQPGESWHYLLTWRLNTRNRWAFYNSWVFTYEIWWESITNTWWILVEEPNVCWDYILSRQEQCEQLSGWIYLVSDPSVLDSSWHLLPWLICNDACQIQMDNFVNTAVMCDTTFNPAICLTWVVTWYINNAVAKLSITKVAETWDFEAWDEVYFDITINNTWDAIATNVIFTDQWPDNLTITRIETNPDNITINQTDEYLTTNIWNIDPGQSVKIRIYATVNWDVSNQLISNTACAVADWTLKVCDTAYLNIQALDWWINLIKRALTTWTLYYGDEAEREITVTNTGNWIFSWKILDIWPSELQYWWFTSNVVWLTGNVEDWWKIQLTPWDTIRLILTWTVIVDELDQDVENKAILDGELLLSATQTYFGAASSIKIHLEDSDIIWIWTSKIWDCESIEDKDIKVKLPDWVDKVKVPFTCKATDNADPNSLIELYCDSDDSAPTAQWQWKLLSAICEYDKDWIYHPYCKVNDRSNDSCEARVEVDKNDEFPICWDWILEDWEECDLYWNDEEAKLIDKYWHLEDRNDPNYYDSRYASSDTKKYYCNACSIYQENTETPVVTPPNCNYTDVPVSIQKWEKLPFWWDIWADNIVDDSSECNNWNDWKVVKDSMKCTFKIYRKWYENYTAPYLTITLPCDNKKWSFEDEMIKTLADSIEPIFPGYTNSIRYAFGNYLFDTNKWKNTTYWEYKISLDHIDYEYCEDWNVESSTLKNVCQSNFVLTKPYLIQKWATTTLSDTSLNDFYDIEWNRIVDTLNLNKIKTTQLSYYDKWWEINAVVNRLFDKFDNDNYTVSTQKDWITIKKVKWKNIFIMWNWWNDLVTYVDSNPSSTPITVLVKWNLIIKWPIVTPTMFVVKWKVGFRSVDCNKDQIINWIIIAQDWFMSIVDLYNEYWNSNYVTNYNVSLDKPRCMKWWLKVKWLMVWKNIENILKNKRAHLNDWFHHSDLSQTLKEERINEIYDWASVLIEHNPNLWLNLPPWAAYIKDTLKTWR